MTCSASRPTVAASGLPPKVEPCEPGVNTSISSRVPTKADTGSTPPPSALPRMSPSGRMPSCSYANQRPVRPRPGLHLVEDQQHVVLVAELAQPGQIAVGRHDDAGLALDRLDQHGRGVGRDRALDRGEVAERHRLEARRERAEAVAIVGLGRERRHRGGAAVEVAVSDDDLGLVLGDALDAIAPAARRLDGGLDRLGAGVHRHHGIEPGEPADLGEERPEPVAVIGARRHRQAVRLRGQRRENARMRVAEADGRIGAHHVDVAPAGGVPQIGVLAARQHDRQRRVVRRRIPGLECDVLVDRGDGVHGEPPGASLQAHVSSLAYIYARGATQCGGRFRRRRPFRRRGGRATADSAVAVRRQRKFPDSCRSPG